MSADRRRKGCLAHNFGFGVALGLYISGHTALAEQPPQVPQQPTVFQQGSVATIPDSAALPLATNTGAANGVGENACCPTWCDPVSRVPNFFGDFVARPSRALVDQPRISSFNASGIPKANTLTFLGLPNDVAGGLHRPNTFYAPFTSGIPLNTGIGGPGGPYPITSNVTGFGVILPPKASILDENAELTARIRAQFPGAIFDGGIGLLKPPFAVMFDYLQTTGTGPTAGQTVPGLVALVSLANPAGGGLVGRNNYFDDGSPVPRDRVFFDYNGVAAFNGLGTPLNINRYVIGVEKTFFDGDGSIELRVPFAGTVNSDQYGGQALDTNHAEFGNVAVLLKGVVYRNANCIVSAGMGVSMPTADDSRILFDGMPVLEIRNKAWLLQPILGAAWAPNDRFYAQAGLQFDFDGNGNPVYVRNPSGVVSRVGLLTDQSYVYAGGALGYWLYKADSEFLSGVSLQGELNYNRTLGNRDFVQTGSVIVTDLNDNMNVLNATTGVNLAFSDRANLALGVSFPVSSDRLYNWNVIARLNVRFGARD